MEDHTPYISAYKQTVISCPLIYGMQAVILYGLITSIWIMMTVSAQLSLRVKVKS